MTDKQITWGFIGCGDVTEVKSGPAFTKVSSSRVAIVMRRNQDKAADYARRHHIPDFTNQAQEVIDHPEVNAIYIATPPSNHVNYALAAAKAGKHIYVEKPLSCSHQQAQSILKACEQNQVKFFVAYYRRHLGQFEIVKRLLNEKAIGTVRSVQITLCEPLLDVSGGVPWRVEPKIAGGGLFADLGSHQFDVLDWLLGPIAKAKGIATNQAGAYPAEDSVSASFLFENGITGSGLWNFCSHTKKDELIVTGSHGEISLPVFANKPVILQNGKGKQEFFEAFPEHVHQPLVAAMVSDLLHGTQLCRSTGTSAARTEKVLDSILGADYRMGLSPLSSINK